MKPAFCLLLTLFSSTLIWAANFTTQSWQTDLEIAYDRSVTITETIGVTFSIPQHGIIRNIPSHYSLANGTTRTIRYELISVTLNRGSGFQMVPSQQGGNERDWVLKIGDRNATLKGKATYKIKYRAFGALNDFPSSDPMGAHTELFWNAIGTSWPTGIDVTGCSVRFPKPKPGKFGFRAVLGDLGEKKGVNLDAIPSEKVANNLGVSVLQDPADPDKVRADVRATVPLRLHQGMTVVVALPEGTLAPKTEAEGSVSESAGSTLLPSFDQTTTSIPNGPAGYFIPVIVLPILYWLTNKRANRYRGPRVARFEPPDNVGPSLCGYLVDQRVDPRDVVAGIVGLAQKGAATLRTIGKNQMIVHLRGIENARDVSSFERELYAKLEPYGPDIDPASLRGSFGSDYQALSAMLHQEAVDKQFVRAGGPGQGCAWGCGFLVALLTISVVCLFFSLLGTIVGFIATGIAGIILLARMTIYLPAGTVAVGQIEGLREFIGRAQKDQMRSMLGREPDQAMFEELLPFAVAFGMVDRWFAAFDGLNITQPSWYESDLSDIYWYSALSNGFTDFDRDMGSALAYIPSPTSTSDEGGGFSGGSSGFDGGSWGGGDSGGSVGDGGGGGGGDSW